ncbi:MAG TPA: polysaccharide deacetylase family protein [Usitatibacter sp.]|nr:polysaccharide deacetylase family protein [Usitatibacter sp.]
MRPPLRHHGRHDYSAITKRPDYSWSGGRRLAVYLGLNLEHFAFGEGLGAALGPVSPPPDVLNHSWREYGNRVGAWRLLELFESLRMPAGVIVNTSMYDHAPELVAAFARRGDEMIGHGHTNSERQGTMGEDEERALLAYCRERIREESGTAPRGWLSPWISESMCTPDLLAETGYRYTLNWCHDDQPTRFATRAGPIWSIPYPQELNDIPMIAFRQMDARDFADVIVDHFDEMHEQSKAQPLVMGLALHGYIVGQPYRLRHLRRALQHIATAKDVWITTPGAILDHVESLPAGTIP